MNEKQKLLHDIDNAIDMMNVEEINKGIEALRHMESQQIIAEDPKIFAARIKNLSKKEQINMKPKKYLKLAAIAAVVAALGASVYAANVLNVFSFAKDDRFVVLRTTENMTQKEAEDLIDVDINERPEQEAHDQEAPAANVESKDLTFNSIEEAEKEMDMKLILPASMPDMKISSIVGTILEWGKGIETRSVWLNYEDENGRLFGITTSREITPKGESVTRYTSSEMDKGSQGSYKSKQGLEFTTLTETDEAGERTAHIANIIIGEYNYAVVFFGFDEKERKAVLDSVDLSAYQQ